MTVGACYPTLLLKRHLEDLVQRGYLEIFILDQEKDLEVKGTPDESID